MPDLLKVLADNPALFEAVRAAVLKEFDTEAGEVDVLNNNQLGERVRARIAGKEAVEAAFANILKYKTQIPAPERINRAR